MKILYAEDLEEIRDLVEMQIHAHLDVEISMVSNGKEAYQLWQQNGPFDLVMSDYHMPEMNGSELFRAIRKLDSTCPFILVSSHQPDQETFSDFFIDSKHNKSILKPDDLLSLPMMIADMTRQSSLERAAYHRVKISTLGHLNQLPADLYIRLSEKKYVKVIAANELFSRDLLEHYQKKVDTLYCLAEQFEALSQSFFEQVKSAIGAKAIDSKADSQQIVELQLESVSLAHQILNLRGITPEVIELANTTLSTVYRKVANSHQTHTILRKVLDNTASYLYIHSLSIPYVATAICHKMNWTSSATLETLATAALLHDSTLDESLIDRFFGVVFDEKRMAERKTNMGLRRIYDHPMASSSLITSDLHLPPMVAKIILEHHERPDGSGYPQKLTAEQIDPLSAIFIVSEAFIHEVKRRGVTNAGLEAAIVAVQQDFRKGHFASVVKALAQVFSNVGEDG